MPQVGVHAVRAGVDGVSRVDVGIAVEALRLHGRGDRTLVDVVLERGARGRARAVRSRVLHRPRGRGGAARGGVRDGRARSVVWNSNENDARHIATTRGSRLGREADEGETVAEVEAKSSNVMLYAMGGIIAFMLAAILVAMLARQASRNKMMRERAIERKAEEQLMDEEERRQQWIDYYVANGEFDKARELGWVDPASLPAWKQHEIQQQEALQASIPSMLDLD